MGLDLLDAPLRLTWDIPGSGEGLTTEQLLQVAERVVDAGIFFVTLEERPLLHPGAERLASALADGGCQLLLSCGGTKTELETLGRLGVGPVRVLLDASTFLAQGCVDEAALIRACEGVRKTGYEPTITLTPLRRNLALLPDLVRCCDAHGITHFKLPNANIGDSFRGYSASDLPRTDDLERFRKLWAARGPDDGARLQLEIHDLFLWEIMSPGDEKARSEYGGCQAGNSLGHVDARGDLHPCAAWPQKLGSLLESSIDTLWQSAARTSVREEIAVDPEGCTGCVDLQSCFGGCRGLSRVLNRDAGGCDLMCAGPRSRT